MLIDNPCSQCKSSSIASIFHIIIIYSFFKQETQSTFQNNYMWRITFLKQETQRTLQINYMWRITFLSLHLKTLLNLHLKVWHWNITPYLIHVYVLTIGWEILSLHLKTLLNLHLKFWHWNITSCLIIVNDLTIGWEVSFSMALFKSHKDNFFWYYVIFFWCYM
jgi:hypothetical protein